MGTRSYSLLFILAAALAAIFHISDAWQASNIKYVKVGANSADLDSNIYANTLVPIMRNMSLMNDFTVWNVNGIDHEIVVKLSGVYEISGSIDLVYSYDSLSNNCSMQFYVVKNSSRISPYYRAITSASYDMGDTTDNIATVVIPSMLFTCRVSDTLSLRCEPMNQDTCEVRMQNSESYLQIIKH